MLFSFAAREHLQFFATNNTGDIQLSGSGLNQHGLFVVGVYADRHVSLLKTRDQGVAPNVEIGHSRIRERNRSPGQGRDLLGSMVPTIHLITSTECIAAFVGGAVHTRQLDGEPIDQSGCSLDTQLRVLDGCIDVGGRAGHRVRKIDLLD